MTYEITNTYTGLTTTMSREEAVELFGKRELREMVLGHHPSIVVIEKGGK